MMFASDIDLVRLEPGLFSMVGWASQRRFVGTGPISGGVLTANTPGSFVAAGIPVGGGAGWVVQVSGVVYEILEVLSNSTLTLARIAEQGATPVSPLNQASGGIEISTFRPQIGIVHRQVLRSIGIDPDAPQPDGSQMGGELGVSAVRNPEGLRLLESLGALHLILAAASASLPAGSPLAERAEWYRMRYSDERGRIVARIDTDGDGVADATRRPTVVPLVRG